MDVRVATAIAGLLMHCTTAAAAPFVQGAATPLRMQIAASRAAVIARPADAARSADAAGGWTVLAVLHDATGSVQRAAVITPQPAPPSECRLALLMSTPTRSVVAVPLSPAAARYLTALPAEPATADVRLRSVLPSLNADDPQISADAFAELAAIETADLWRLADQLPVAVLRDIVNDPATPGERLGLFGWLLGLCGNGADAATLRQRVLEARGGFLDGADGLAAGYLLLGGEAGLADLEANVLLTTQTTPLQAAAVLDAVAFFRSMPLTFPAERLRRAICCGLRRPDCCGLAIEMLQSSSDWDAAPEVAAALRACDPSTDAGRASQVAAAKFMLGCRDAREATVAQRRLAVGVLNGLAATDPDLHRRAALLAAEPPPTRH